MGAGHCDREYLMALPLYGRTVKTVAGFIKEEIYSVLEKEPVSLTDRDLQWYLSLLVMRTGLIDGDCMLMETGESLTMFQRPRDEIDG